MRHSQTIDFTRVFDLLEYHQRKFPEGPVASLSVDGEWKSWTIGEIKSLADAISSWLIATGIEHGDRITVIPKNGNPYWLAVDMGCLQVGAVVVPIHPTSSNADMLFVLKETEAKGCIAADAALASRVSSLMDLPFVQHLETPASSWSALTERTPTSPVLSLRKEKVAKTDVASIMYTSGTSGVPKGAILTHDNIVCSIKSVLTLLPLEPGHRVLSFLPFSHIFERVSCYAYLGVGVTIYFSASLETLAADFRSVRPYFCTTVPRTLEKMYDYLEEQREQRNFLIQLLIGWAMQVGSRYGDHRNGIGFKVQLLLARLLVLYRWRKSLGGKLRFMIVGAAALRPEIGKLFSAAGILTLSGYGMTEASPFISTNRYLPGLNRFGTVGVPVPGVDVQIESPDADGSGEILVKGPNIMQGYYKRPELNDQVFTPERWLRTGDVGYLTDRRFLVITDRKKDIFKTTTGKYVAPQAVQNHLSTSPFISQSLVIGFNRAYVVAIVVPHFQLLKSWCEQHSIHWTSPPYMVHNIKVIQKYQEEIDRLNEGLQSHERIRKFILSEAEWTVESRELTTSFKPVRHNLLEKHKVEIEKLYQ